jgi:mycothiol synthase
MSETRPRHQLQMLLPEEVLASPPPVHLPQGYAMRTFRPGDEEGHIAVMRSATFDGWNHEQLRAALLKTLPDGMFLAVHNAAAAVVGTATATHNPSEHHAFGGELGWVAVMPQHTGRGLGKALCAAVIERFTQAGYRRIYLRTDDWRLPAIKVYLSLGFVPFLFAEDMPGRWEEVCAKLGWPYTPLEWPEFG